MKVQATLKDNHERRGIEISFNTIPAAAARDELKMIGFKWNGKTKVWYIRNTKKNRAAALEFLAAFNENKFSGPTWTAKEKTPAAGTISNNDFLDCLAVIGF